MAVVTSCENALQMDGWMDGWVNGWMDGWKEGWMGGWMDKYVLQVHTGKIDLSFL